MKFTRRFTTPGTPVVDLVEWEYREASNPGAGFRMEVEVPRAWSQGATDVFAQRYLRKAGIPVADEPMARRQEGDVPDWLWPSTPLRIKEVITGPETSARQVFHRMAGCWTYWGWRGGYFGVLAEDGSAPQSEPVARIFYDELYWMLANQYAAPNSPQWFNTGLWWAYGIEGPDSGQWFISPTPNGGWVATESSRTWDETVKREPEILRIHNSYERPQVHACFIQPVADTLVGEGGMLDLWAREARLFKHGSGTGTNFSSIRAKSEPLSGGGISSGLMSFLRVGDSNAGSIKSGGVTRRAAKMVVLDLDHPEVEEFVDWKVREESKAAAMHVGSKLLHRVFDNDGMQSDGDDVPAAVINRFDAGFEPEVFSIDGMDAEAVASVNGQNSNNSVRVPDQFIEALNAFDGAVWGLTNRTDGKVAKHVNAKDLWHRICRAAWACGDPGLQFSDTINAWHTCPNDGEIRASNPCFTGDTLVWTLYGPRRFDELARDGKDVKILTEDEGGKLVYRTMHDPRKTRDRAPLVEITLKAQCGPGRRASITTLRCTPDHSFYLKNGAKIRAVDLRPKDRVESAYRRRANQKGYIGVYATSGDSVMEHHLIAEMEYGRRPVYPYEHGHHLDEAKANNVPGNVEIIAANEHNSQHMLGDRNPMRCWFGSLNEDEKRAHLSKMSVAASGERNPNYGNKGHLANRRWITNGRDNVRVLPENIPVGWRYGKTHRRPNHMVVKVERLTDQAEVYCGTVESTGRFFVSLGDQHREGVLVSNCSEYLFLDDTACNLASLNLRKFLSAPAKTKDLLLGKPDEFDCGAFEHAVCLWTVVLDISVSMASYPSREIAEGSYNYRTLGLGYANLGGLLAQLDLRYDSDAGRALAAGVTALMTGAAYRTSAEMAASLGPFPRWEANAEPMCRVLNNHLAASVFGNLRAFDGLNVEPEEINISTCHDQFPALRKRAMEILVDVTNAESFRNAQVTLLAPTGTISLVMDCDTSGVEPYFSRRSMKQLAGGGSMVFEHPGVLDEDCAVPSEPDGACLSWESHVRMVAAVQPFLSGGVSKTVNMPHSTTVEDVGEAFHLAHQLGLKSISIYRDGSKLTQPLSTAVDDRVDKSDTPEANEEWFKKAKLHLPGVDMARSEDEVSYHAGLLKRGQRRNLPSLRPGASRAKLEVAGHSFYLHTGDHEDGELGEIFLDIGKAGSDVRAWAECFCKAVSLGLQYGVPLDVFVHAFERVSFEPSGMVSGATRIRFCDSLPDFVFRHLAVERLGRDDLASVPRSEDFESVAKVAAEIAPALAHAAHAAPSMVMISDICPHCGTFGRMRRTGTCLTCEACGHDEGCG